MDKLLFTPAEAAALTGLSRSRIYELMSANELKSVTIGKSRRISRIAIEDFVRALECRRDEYSSAPGATSRAVPSVEVER